MRVHVPEPGDEELAGRVHHLGSFGGADLLARAERGDLLAREDDGHIGLGRRAGHVDDRDVGEGDVAGRRGMSGGAEQGEREQRGESSHGSST